MTPASPSDLWPAPGVYLVAVDDDIVGLNVPDDAYFCLPDAAAGITWIAEGGLRLADAGLARELSAAGLLRPAPPDPSLRTRPAPPAPTRSALPDRALPPDWGNLGPAVGAVFDIAATYRGRPLEALLAQARTSARATPTVTPHLLAQVEDFHRWAPYAPVSGKCLLRSYMLLRHLRRVGLDALWVFGVRIWPFHAHCWLQCDTVVLDDHAERVAAFTPILTV